MSIEIRLRHTKCNLSCKYCYENPLRKIEEDTGNIDWEAIQQSLETLSQYDRRLVISGGEPLLTPKEDLEKLMSTASDVCESLSVQTNAALIDDEHIELFKKYNVTVGISVDGFSELNDYRWAGSKEETREQTRRTLINLKKIKNNNLSGGVIATLHKANAGDNARLDKFKYFLKWLGEKAGVPSGNIHFMELSKEDRGYALSKSRNRKVFLELARFFENNLHLEWKPFSDMKKLIQGKDSKVSCIWTFCDPWSTRTLYGLETDGSVGCCSRGVSSGIDHERSMERSFERYLSLYQTPQSMGGCKGCRFFIMCNGVCPGSTAGKDWRNRTHYCSTFKSLFEFYERKAKKNDIEPISLAPCRQELEQRILDRIKAGKQPRMNQELEHLD